MSSVRRNRRYAHMRVALDASGYFSVDSMRARDPRAFDEIVGVDVRKGDAEPETAAEDGAGERILARERAREVRAAAEARWEEEFGDASASDARFGDAFASSSGRAVGRGAAKTDGKVSDAAWRRAMFEGWDGATVDGDGDGDGDARGERRAATTAEEATEEATFIVDVDEYRASRGRSRTYISQAEYVSRAADFERVMRERFLAGGDDGFDYLSVDADAALDAHWRREIDQDAEDKYFDED